LSQPGFSLAQESAINLRLTTKDENITSRNGVYNPVLGEPFDTLRANGIKAIFKVMTSSSGWLIAGIPSRI